MFLGITSPAARASFIGLHTLEPRMLMAGDVTTSLNDGVLVIAGDEQDNVIHVTQNEGGELVITGDLETTLSLDDVRVIEFQLNQGDDELNLTDVEFEGRIDIRQGRGDDDFNVDNLTLGRRLVVRTQGGLDTMHIDDSTLGRVLIVGDNANLGSKTFKLHHSTLNGRLDVKLKRGHDRIGITASTIKGTTNLSTGVGQDFVAVNHSTFKDRVRFTTGTENDLVTVRNSTVEGQTSIATNRGNDIVELWGSTINKKLHVNLGGNSDTLYEFGMTLPKAWRFSGSSGTDTVMSDRAMEVWVTTGDGPGYTLATLDERSRFRFENVEKANGDEEIHTTISLSTLDIVADPFLI